MRIGITVGRRMGPGPVAAAPCLSRPAPPSSSFSSRLSSRSSSSSRNSAQFQLQFAATNTVLASASITLFTVPRRHKSCGIVGLPNVGKVSFFLLSAPLLPFFF